MIVKTRNIVVDVTTTRPILANWIRSLILFVTEIFQLKMVLIKCCDISNEVRPFEVSEPWVDCLLEEYFNQVRVYVCKLGLPSKTT